MISDPWLRHRTPQRRVIDWPDVKARRDKLRAANKCINGPLVGNVGASGVVHGPPVSGGKCQRCVEQHKRSR